ncbi:maleylacetoacetate isomerase [Acinetobacter sp. ANC 4173]|uniref:maleylacetoacetate isomerase n=1 Tax=Acinetobacter sp. ANC 4173 TaxID=2529837 RepID=UPI0010404CCA|nr:maleylacetoacetate isomerase [Acinetobacter sp. ANC 4173]TCB77263.1 maleylacetoacetate isomerase [Acinetobacter sp. ANC 4173]
MQLYSYFRSSASYRVRIALNLKNLPFDVIPIHLLKNGGEQHSINYKKINPGELVPTLIDENVTLTQSMSILEYLEEKYSSFPLLPSDIQSRALIRSFCQTIVSDIHPLNNLRVLQYLKKTISISDEEINKWYEHWIITGFNVLEKQLSQSNKKYCFGNNVSLADCCLIPQVYNAQRFNIDLTQFPMIKAIYNHCIALPEFNTASPEVQIDEI